MSFLFFPVIKLYSLFMEPFEQLEAYVQSRSTLWSTIEFLHKENHYLKEQLIQQIALQRFVQETEDMVAFASRYDSNQQLLTKILFTSISSREDVAIIDKGFQYKVEKDDVVVYKNMLIGRVIEVYPWYSKVAFITDKRCKISAQTNPEVVGICSGKNNGELEFNFVPHFKAVKNEDLVLSNGNGLVYPQGFALGKVISCKTDNVAHYIQLAPLLDFRSLSYVYIFKHENVVIPQKEENFFSGENEQQ